MKKRIIFKILVSVLASVSVANTSSAIFVSAEYSAGYEDSWRRGLQVPEKQSLDSFLSQEIKRLKAVPENPEIIIKIADYIHVKGHLEEAAKNFMDAYELHTEALSYYVKVKNESVVSVASWDGIEHSLEHMFLDLFDQGYLLALKGEKADAKKYFERAYLFTQSSAYVPKLLLTLLGKERFPQRYLSLLKYKNSAAYESIIDMYLDKKIKIHDNGILKEVNLTLLMSEPEAGSCAVSLL